MLFFGNNSFDISPNILIIMIILKREIDLRFVLGNQSKDQT